nr:hypothetical protein BaRGS_010710 [Batillaria attramentaria]
MSQIPGKDNYLADITDNVFGLTKMEVDRNRRLNVGYYHRWYRVVEEGAMGEKTSRRGYADRNLFVAETTQTRVAPIKLESCKRRRNKKVCTTLYKRITYAIPLEIVFSTPLHTWNPFNIEYKGSSKSELGKTVEADGRNGKRLPEKAFNGTNSKNFYLTPVHFFSGGEVGKDSADTTRKSVGVLDRDGVMRSLKPSGIRIFLPEIEGVGVLRTRFPIAPIHAEGSPIWKELEALRDVVMNMQKYHKYLYDQRHRH